MFIPSFTINFSKTQTKHNPSIHFTFAFLSQEDKTKHFKKP